MAMRDRSLTPEGDHSRPTLSASKKASAGAASDTMINELEALVGLYQTSAQKGTDDRTPRPPVTLPTDSVWNSYRTNTCLRVIALLRAQRPEGPLFAKILLDRHRNTHPWLELTAQALDAAERLHKQTPVWPIYRQLLHNLRTDPVGEVGDPIHEPCISDLPDLTALAATLGVLNWQFCTDLRTAATACAAIYEAYLKKIPTTRACPVVQRTLAHTVRLAIRDLQSISSERLTRGMPAYEALSGRLVRPFRDSSESVSHRLGVAMAETLRARSKLDASSPPILPLSDWISDPAGATQAMVQGAMDYATTAVGTNSRTTRAQSCPRQLLLALYVGAEDEITTEDVHRLPIWLTPSAAGRISSVATDALRSCTVPVLATLRAQGRFDEWLLRWQETAASCAAGKYAGIKLSLDDESGEAIESPAPEEPTETLSSISSRRDGWMDALERRRHLWPSWMVKLDPTTLERLDPHSGRTDAVDPTDVKTIVRLLVDAFLAVAPAASVAPHAVRLAFLVAGDSRAVVDILSGSRRYAWTDAPTPPDRAGDATESLCEFYRNTAGSLPTEGDAFDARLRELSAQWAMPPDARPGFDKHVAEVFSRVLVAMRESGALGSLGFWAHSSFRSAAHAVIAEMAPQFASSANIATPYGPQDARRFYAHLAVSLPAASDSAADVAKSLHKSWCNLAIVGDRLRGTGIDAQPKTDMATEAVLERIGSRPLLGLWTRAFQRLAIPMARALVAQEGPWGPSDTSSDPLLSEPMRAMVYLMFENVFLPFATTAQLVMPSEAFVDASRILTHHGAWNMSFRMRSFEAVARVIEGQTRRASDGRADQVQTKPRGDAPNSIRIIQSSFDAMRTQLQAIEQTLMDETALVFHAAADPKASGRFFYDGRPTLSQTITEIKQGAVKLANVAATSLNSTDSARVVAWKLELTHRVDTTRRVLKEYQSAYSKYKGAMEAIIQAFDVRLTSTRESGNPSGVLAFAASSHEALIHAWQLRNELQVPPLVVLVDLDQIENLVQTYTDRLMSSKTLPGNTSSLTFRFLALVSRFFVLSPTRIDLRSIEENERQIAAFTNALAAAAPFFDELLRASVSISDRETQLRPAVDTGVDELVRSWWKDPRNADLLRTITSKSRATQDTHDKLRAWNVRAIALLQAVHRLDGADGALSERVLDITSPSRTQDLWWVSFLMLALNRHVAILARVRHFQFWWCTWLKTGVGLELLFDEPTQSKKETSNPEIRRVLQQVRADLQPLLQREENAAFSDLHKNHLAAQYRYHTQTWVRVARHAEDITADGKLCRDAVRMFDAELWPQWTRLVNSAASKVARSSTQPVPS